MKDDIGEVHARIDTNENYTRDENITNLECQIGENIIIRGLPGLTATEPEGIIAKELNKLLKVDVTGDEIDYVVKLKKNNSSKKQNQSCVQRRGNKRQTEKRKRCARAYDKLLGPLCTKTETYQTVSPSYVYK